MTRHGTTIRATTMAGRLTRCVIVLPSLLWGIAMAADGEKPQADAAAAGRATQQRARAMAQELVAGVLDVQIRQLEENGLASRPIHAEITAMRGNIDALVNREMREVVELLANAETAAAGERAALVKDARALVRGIVARLSMERQQILRRLRVADIAAQVRRLIDRQQTVRTTTDSLPRQVDGRREAVALAAIEDQRTVRTLYDTLTLALEDVSGWGGSVGSGAVTGLRMLEESQVAAALAAAEGSLGTLDFAAASAAQQRVAESLEKLLATIDTSRGAGGGNAAVALETLRGLTERGTQLRREMEKTPLTDAAVEQILDSQADFRAEMGKLAETLRGVPDVESLIEQADASAQEATSAVFEGDQQRAVAEEGKVIGALAAIAGRLHKDATMPSEARAAEQLARRLDDLRRAAAEMAAVGRRQAQATQAARANPPAAMAMEREVAAEVARIAAAGDMPPVVDARMEHAAEAAAAAARPPVPGMPQAAADAAALAAQRAIEAATAEIAAAIADTERARLAAKAGELSRAAEAVERAAAAERALARQARQVERSERAAPGEQAAQPDPRADAFEDLTDAQQAVAEVAAKLTDAVRATAPQAAETLANAQEPMQAVRREFETLAALDHRSDVQEPGEPAAREDLAGERTPGDQQAGDTKPGDHQLGERQPGDKQPGEQKQSEQQPGQQQAGQRQTGEEPAAREASAQQSDGQQPAAQREAEAPGAAQQTQQQADQQTPAPTDPATQSADAAMPKERGSDDQARREHQAGDQSAAAEAAERAAAEAERAAEMLARAAMEMRREAEEAAQELARSAEAQAEQVATARAAAEKAAAPQNQPGQPGQLAEAQPAGAPQTASQRQQEQALANLAARETELVRDRVLAEEMLEAAREQSMAREAIAAQSAALERAESADGKANAGADMPPDSAAAHEAAESLQRAEEQFADAQRTLGENAAAILEQSELANQPLREALEQASQLDAEAGPSPTTGKQESGMPGPREQQSQAGQSQPEGQAGEQGQSQQGQSQQSQQPQQAQAQDGQPQQSQAQQPQAQQGQTQQGQSQAGQAQQAQPQQGRAQQGQTQQGQTQQGQTQSQQSQSQQGPAQRGEMGSETEGSLGTGFVPNAPERTAEMIAGRQAQEAAESLLGDDASVPQSGALAADDGGSESPSFEAGSESSGSPDSSGPPSSEAPESDPSQSASSSDGQPAGQSQSAGSESSQSQAGQSKASQQASGQKGSSRSKASGRPESSADGREGSQRGEGGTRGGRRTEATADGPLRQIDAVGKGHDGRTGERSGDAEAAEKSFEREPWFAKLPPEMRKAIRAKSQRRAPRGYEEKLDRYFQNIDE